MDVYQGSVFEPGSLHKYLYCNANPVGNIDPSGRETLFGVTVSAGVYKIITAIAIGFNVGALVGAARGYLSGMDVIDSAASGGLLGAALAPLTLVQLLTPILVIIGAASGLYLTSQDIKEGNYPLAAFDGALAFLGIFTTVTSAARVSYTPKSISNPLNYAEIEADIDAAFSDAAFAKARSGTMFELPGQNPNTGKGLVKVKIKFDPNKPISYHNNQYFEGIDGAPGNGKVEVRYHSANPNAPPGSFSNEHGTTQVNTPNKLYLLPNGQWKTIQAMTPAERAQAHFD